MKQKIFKKRQSGQSMIMLLVFVMMAMAMAFSAVMLMVVNSTSGAELQNGVEVRELAESGAEEGLLSLIRNTSYTGETYTESLSTITVTVNSGTITSVATLGKITRKIQIVTAVNNNALNVVSWKEI